jgi:hypothetical protein
VRHVLLVLPMVLSVLAVAAVAVLGMMVASAGTALARPAAGSDVVNVVSGTERFTMNLEDEVLRAGGGL